MSARARFHEISCAECRVSWGGWLGRIMFRDERAYWRSR